MHALWPLGTERTETTDLGALLSAFTSGGTVSPFSHGMHYYPEPVISVRLLAVRHVSVRGPE